MPQDFFKEYSNEFSEATNQQIQETYWNHGIWQAVSS